MAFANLGAGYPSSDCHLSTNITSFRVIETGSRFARLTWAPQYVFRAALNWHFELDYWSQDQIDGSLPVKLILDNRAKSAVLSDLRPRSSYESRILIRNDCGRTGLPLTLSFHTRPEGIPISQTSSYDIALIVLLLIIWMLILRHFIKKYNKISFVSPNTAFIQIKQHSDQRTNKTSDVDSLRRVSEVSRVSVTNKFELLENVICKWRSETVLENRMPISNRDVALFMDKADLSASMLNVENPYKLPGSRRNRRKSNATDDLRMFDVPSRTKVAAKLSTCSVRPSRSYPLFVKMGSSSALNGHVCPEICYEYYDDLVNAPPPGTTLPYEEIGGDVSEEELERCRLLAKLSGTRGNDSPLDTGDGTIRRKVRTTMVVDHNTFRCSIVSTHVRRPRAPKNAFVRRPSLFRSFRKSFRRKKQDKPRGCSVSGLHSMNSFSSRWFKSFQQSSTERPTPPQAIDTPPHHKCPIDTKPIMKMQTSTESYFTATDVLIQIDPAIKL